ncbi:hypothetical protein [Chryseobacterium sp.]|uniref:hypothetical protein n=1 Tax=Chryseobacterium sp. TaxID=1871047 RepID=UPI000EBB6711|nr:hypothetical protein [Chryseobacterium sp.]HCM33211.1 hypothetical protein [Chryseobacterium sp.]
MITIKAILHLYDNVRKTPFSSGYRPAFDFNSGSLTSGRILLRDETQLFYPGEIKEVEINFMFNEFLKNKLNIGEKVFFYEGSNQLGEIEIKEILDR